jgi:hypothetical protein
LKAANEVILSPIDPAGTTRAISLLSGSNLPANSFIRIGTFANGGTSEADLSNFVSSWTNQATTSSFLDFLNTNFVTWNSLTNTNANSPWPGGSSISVANTNTSTNLVGKPMYIWVYNTSTHAAATNPGSEMLILRSWETNSLGNGFPDRDGGTLGLDSTFNFFPSGPSGIDFPNPDPDDPLPITSYGVSVLFGQYLSDQLQFRLGGITPRVEITSSLTETNASGAVSTYQITANNGADRFFATTNTSALDLTLTTLPTGFSIATNTGVITAGTNAATNNYSIRLVASNSLTASVATNTLTWVLKDPTLSFTSGPSSITATLGKGMTSNFTSSGTDQTYTVTSGKLFGLTLSNSNGVGVLSGTPTSVGSNSVWIQATAGTNVGATNFTLVVNPFSLGIVGLTDAGVLECTAGIAQTNRVTNSEAYTDLDGDFNANPETPGLIFNGSELVIPSSTLPLLKGSSNISLTLTASRAVDGTTVSSSTTVPLRIVAPKPEALVGPTEFEVDVGQAFSTTILSDAGAYGRMSFSNLPSGLVGNQNGVVAGTNRSTNLPYEFPAKVVADSTQIYEGGGTYTNTNVIFRLRNTNPPYFSTTNTNVLASPGRPISPIQLVASNFPSRYSTPTLPPGLQRAANTITGTPTTAGRFEVPVVAYNSYRPGSTNPADEQIGTNTLILTIRVDSTRPTSVAPTAPGTITRNTTISTSDNLYLIPGGAENAGVRIAAYGLPPGISLDPSTGKLFGTTGGPGSYTATVFIQNGRGWIKRTITLTVQ